MTAVFLKILAFVVLITGFYGAIGQLWLTQSEDHPPPELEITVDTDTDTLVASARAYVNALNKLMVKREKMVSALSA